MLNRFFFYNIISQKTPFFKAFVWTQAISRWSFFFVYCSQIFMVRWDYFKDLTNSNFWVTIRHRRKKKSPWGGSLLLCSQRLSTTWLDHAVLVLYDHIFRSAAFGLTTLCFFSVGFLLAAATAVLILDRFLGDHLCFFEVWVLTTFLTIVRSGLHGNSSTREHENVRFGWQNSTKKH